MRTVVYAFVIEEVANAHAQNASLERFFSIPGLELVSRLLSEIC